MDGQKRIPAVDKLLVQRREENLKRTVVSTDGQLRWARIGRHAR